MTCAFCGKDATLYCDFILGFKAGEWSGCTGETALRVGRFDEFVPGKGLPCYTLGSPELYTCDAPMCDECGKHQGNLFMDGEVSSNDSIDMCPVHAGRKDEGKPITADAADRMRLKAWKLRVNP